MRIKLDNPVLSDVRDLLQSDYVSPLPSEDVLAQAWNDPLISKLLSGDAPAIGQEFTKNAIRATRSVLGRAAISTGIPMDLLGVFADAISNAAAEQGAVKWAAIAEATSMAIIDTAMEAAGQIPVIGWSTKIAMAIAKLAQALAKQQKPRPPLLKYTKETDEFHAQKALEIVGMLNSSNVADWTPLFLPQTAGTWDIQTSGDGGLFARGNDDGSGFGCIPPGLFGSRVIQVQHAEEGLDRFANKKSMTNWYLSNVHDAFDQLPSLARIGQAVWSAAASNSSAAIFNMRYIDIAYAWRVSTTAGLEEAEAWIKAGQKKDWRGKPGYATWFPGAAVKFGLTHANYVGGKLQPMGKGPNTPFTAGQAATMWCDFFQQRAIDLCKTTLVAYASQSQTWFDRYDHLTKLYEGREKLLKNDALVRTIRAADVLDMTYRGKIEARQKTVGFDPSPQGVVLPLPGGTVPQRVAAPNGGGGGGGLLIGGLAAAAAVGIAWKLHKG